MKQYSFDMVFKMYKEENDELVCESWQKLAFDDFKGNFSGIQESMLMSVLAHYIPEK